MWKAGDRAICIKVMNNSEQSEAVHQEYSFPDGYPTVDTIYLVNKVRSVVGHEASLCLAGMAAIHIATGIDAGWLHTYFRKVVPKCDQKKVYKRIKIQ